MRLLFITPNFPPDVGGVQTYSAELAQAFVEAGVDLTVVAPNRAEHNDATRNHRVVRTWEPGDNFAFSALGPVTRLLGGHDAVFASHWSAAHAAIVARRLRKRHMPIGCAIHGKELLHRPLGKWPPAQRGYDLVRRRALRLCDVLFPVSHFTASLLPADSRRVVVVPNGVRMDRWGVEGPVAPLRGAFDEDAPLLVTVSRLVSRKGIDTVLEALVRLRDEGMRVNYVVGGSGPDRERLDAIVTRHRLQDRVRFVGRVPDETLAAHYRAADLFVLTPRQEGDGDFEGFGLVYLEAGACGRPVLGSRSGGVSDAVMDGVTGALIPPENPNALAARLRSLLADPDELRNLGAAGVVHAEACGWDAAAASILDALRP